jgi:hypothetical protein
MMLVYVAWMAIWQAVYDPCLWTGAVSSHGRAQSMSVGSVADRPETATQRQSCQFKRNH